MAPSSQAVRNSTRYAEKTAVEQQQSPAEASIEDLFKDPPPVPEQVQVDPQAPVEGAPQVAPPVPQPVPQPQVHQVPLTELLDTRHRAQRAEEKAQYLESQLSQISR